LTAFADYLTAAFPGLDIVLQILNFAISLAVIATLFAMIFKILPDPFIAWSDVWVGATITALLFSVAKFLISLYIGNSDVASSYGAAGALVVVLLWVYYSAQILLLGAEITRAYAERYGSRRGEAASRAARETAGSPETPGPGGTHDTTPASAADRATRRETPARRPAAEGSAAAVRLAAYTLAALAIIASLRAPARDRGGPAARRI
jgi:membrane protein